MAVSIHLSNLHFSSGDQVSLAPDSIVVFVGPNSSGKTQSLKDIWRKIARYNQFVGVSITDATMEKLGTNDQYLEFIKNNSIVHNNSITLPGVHVSPPSALDGEWNRQGLRYVGPAFATLIEAADRLSAINQRQRIDRSKDKAKHPLPALDLDPENEKEVSKSFHAIFGKHIMLDRGAGAVVNLHVGVRPDSKIYGGEYSPNYSTEVRKCPDIVEEGDGLKAVAGLFLNILSIPKCIYLIDEPDVYLHPPQAYAAAREIVNIGSGKQLFMATHNAHFVRGLLDTNSQRIVLIRLDRSDENQSVNIIENTIFSEIESDPLIRFSNLLEAMFFRTAIICESEADCLFYRNLCRVVDQSSRDDDVFWLSAHGKQNIRKFSTILRKLGLRVLSIPDLDIINDEYNLRSLFDSHGGLWINIESDFFTLNQLMRERKPTSSFDDIKTKILKILNVTTSGKDGLFPTDAARGIRSAMNSASPWREIKESGVKALGKGGNQRAAENLLRELEEVGILIPTVGEMESFYLTSSLHGIEWVDEVLGLDVANDDRLLEARQFAGKIISARS